MFSTILYSTAILIFIALILLLLRYISNLQQCTATVTTLDRNPYSGSQGMQKHCHGIDDDNDYNLETQFPSCLR